jgi:hypothetical protein
MLGDIHYAQVKKSLGYYKGDHLPIDRSRALLRSTAKTAIQDAGKIAPIKCELPVTIEVDVSPDPITEPALAARPMDNASFADYGRFGDSAPISDVELILRTHPHVTSPRRGTVSFTAGDYFTAYRTLYSILGQIYERDIENLVDIVAETESYARPDLENIVGRDYPLNEIGPRRKYFG